MTTATQAEIQATTDAYEELYATGEDKTFTGDDAVRWGKDTLKSTYWSMQEEIMRSVFDNRLTAVRSCNSVGKTFIASDIALTFLLNMTPSIVATTAPRFQQVRDVLWQEIRTKYELHLANGMNDIECQQTRLEIAPGWFMVGLSPEKGVGLQGLHQVNVLVICDEAPGVRLEIMQAAKTLMASGNAHMLWIGNPLESRGEFYNAFAGGGGWNAKHISYEMTPNFTGEELPENIKNQLISPQWVDERREEWGEDSPLFLSSCLGEFPLDNPRAVIPLKLCMDSIAREIVPEGDLDMGIDCGGGGDLTVYTKKRGNVITEIITESTPDVMQIPYVAMRHHRKENFRFIKVDKGGLGHGVVNRMGELDLPVIGVFFGGSANDTEQYVNKRTELWCNMKKWLEYGKIPDDPKLVAELTSTQFLDKLTAKGQLQLESKKETKKRLGRSPDRADSLALAVDQVARASGTGILFL